MDSNNLGGMGQKAEGFNRGKDILEHKGQSCGSLF
jgi:hypothetical protein